MLQGSRPVVSGVKLPLPLQEVLKRLILVSSTKPWLEASEWNSQDCLPCHDLNLSHCYMVKLHPLLLPSFYQYLLQLNAHEYYCPFNWYSLRESESVIWGLLCSETAKLPSSQLLWAWEGRVRQGFAASGAGWIVKGRDACGWGAKAATVLLPSSPLLLPFCHESLVSASCSVPRRGRWRWWQFAWGSWRVQFFPLKKSSLTGSFWRCHVISVHGGSRKGWAPSGYREQWERGPAWACGKINFHLHRECLKAAAAFVLGSDGRLPACVCKEGLSFNTHGVWLFTTLLTFHYLVNTLPFLWDASIS